MNSNTSSWGLPWVEKYRPKSLDDVVGNGEAIARLKVIGSQGNMPNLLISGPPGIGKTTAIMCLASAMLTPEQFPEAFLELNASDERGIDVVRSSIKMFATKKVTLPAGRHKIVLLDEADSMTTGAQQALRRIMELYAGTTRFALLCNHSSKIIEPIQSRCAILRFFPPSSEDICSRLLEIATKEAIQISSDGLEVLVSTAGEVGDLRQAIHTLQAAAGAAAGSIIDASVLSLVANKPQPTELASLLARICEGDLRASIAKANQLLAQGYATLDIVNGLFRAGKAGFSPSDSTEAGSSISPDRAMSNQKLQISMLKELGLTQMRTVDGHASKLQLFALVSRLCTMASPNSFRQSPIALTK